LPCLEDSAMRKTGRNRPGPAPEGRRLRQIREPEEVGMGTLLTLPLRLPVQVTQGRLRGAETVSRGDISEAYKVKGKVLCRVPVAQDVRYCDCGGLLSQRLNESLFCRTCGRDGSL
jgi:hypothetical protein